MERGASCHVRCIIHNMQWCLRLIQRICLGRWFAREKKIFGSADEVEGAELSSTVHAFERNDFCNEWDGKSDDLGVVRMSFSRLALRMVSKGIFLVSKLAKFSALVTEDFCFNFAAISPLNPMTSSQQNCGLIANNSEPHSPIQSPKISQSAFNIPLGCPLTISLHFGQ